MPLIRVPTQATASVHGNQHLKEQWIAAALFVREVIDASEIQMIIEGT